MISATCYVYKQIVSEKLNFINIFFIHSFSQNNELSNCSPGMHLFVFDLNFENFLVFSEKFFCMKKHSARVFVSQFRCFFLGKLFTCIQFDLSIYLNMKMYSFTCGILFQPLISKLL